MRIAATSVSMDAARTYREVTETENQTQRLVVNGGTRQTSGFTARFSNLVSTTSRMALDVSTIVESRNPASPHCGQVPASRLSELLAAQVLGEPVRLASWSQPEEQTAVQGNGPIRDLGWGMVGLVHRAEIQATTVVQEQESVLVSAAGTILTEDGRSLTFTMGLQLARTTTRIRTFSLETVSRLIDPLVLNFSSTLPSAGDLSFTFDMDADGQAESLACPGRGCGFLALDRNGDGIINNGLELFGPESGSGFAELALLDTDSNLWIDENDPIFDRLLIWSPQENDGQLQTLAEAGVGAIALTHAGTSFNLENTSGSLRGQVSASGLFLLEDGSVRSMQELDLAVEGAEGDRTGMLTGEADAIAALRQLIWMQRVRLRVMLVRRQMARDHRMELRENRLLDLLLRRRPVPSAKENDSGNVGMTVAAAGRNPADLPGLG